ncbi:MAG: TRAP transporter substrate-binding protein DctP [Thermoactinomyces sp.]
MQKRMLKAALLTMAVIVILGMAGCGSSQSDSNHMVLKLADNQAPDYPTVIGDNEFAKLVKERTKGRIEVKVYPSAQLGDEKSVIEQVQLGAIDFARVIPHH